MGGSPDGIGVDRQLTWLITGASSGLGAALVEACIASGQSVVATARRPDALPAPTSRAVLRVRLDVTDPESIDAAVQQAVGEFGGIDVLVNNAGYGTVGAVEEFTDRQVRDQFETNVFGIFATLRAVLPGMRSRRSGHIVNVSSVAGLHAGPGLGVYAATKHAVEGLSESLAAELAPLGIAVTIVEPGAFRTNWAGTSMVAAATSPDYEHTPVAAVRRGLAALNGRQAGDPARAAAAMVDHVLHGRSRLRLPLGDDAVSVLRTHAADLIDAADAGAPTARATAFQFRSGRA